MNEQMQLLMNMMKSGFTSAQRLLNSGMNVNALRTNATLRKDEWKLLDDAIIAVARDRLVGYSDLLSRGLTYTITNGLGTTILESENVSDFNDAELSMDGVTKSDNDVVNYEVVGIPMPLLHKSYQISIRKLAASRNRGESLDTTQAELATRKIAEKQETMLFNGTSDFSFGGYTIYGYTDFPSRQTVSMGTSWTTDTGANIIADVLAAKQKAIDKGQFGPYVLYVSTNIETNLDNDYSTSKGDNTIRERILKITGIQDVKVADKLTASHAVLVQMTKDNVRADIGLPLTNVQWDDLGGMINKFKVMTITVPELRTDQDGNSGIIDIS